MGVPVGGFRRVGWRSWQCIELTQQASGGYGSQSGLTPLIFKPMQGRPSIMLTWLGLGGGTGTPLNFTCTDTTTAKWYFGIALPAKGSYLWPCPISPPLLLRGTNRTRSHPLQLLYAFKWYLDITPNLVTSVEESINIATMARSKLNTEKDSIRVWWKTK